MEGRSRRQTGVKVKLSIYWSIYIATLCLVGCDRKKGASGLPFTDRVMNSDEEQRKLF